MIARLIEFALSQRLMVLVLTVALVAGGVWSFRALPIDAFPDISPTQVKLILKAPGMTPEEVETRVVVPLEMELLGIPRQTVLRSMAKYAIADITIDFAAGTDIYWARQQVAERYANVAQDLPSGISGGLAPLATPLSDLFMFTIEGSALSAAERRTLLDWTLRPALRNIPGVADVNALGGEVRAFVVVPDHAALARAGLTFGDLADAIERNNRNDGAGRLSEGETAVIVRAEGALRTAADIAALVVTARDGVALSVGDVAEVAIDSVTRYGAVTRDGDAEAVQGLVVGLRGADAQAVVRAVRARLAELAPLLPPGITLEVFYDRGTLIERAVGTVGRALVEASVLVVLLLLVFLGEFRAALIVALMLPLAALATFGLMHLSGLSANLMSLGGLAIAIGMLVDAAVVVVENTIAHLSGAQNRQVPRLHVIYRSAREVAVPVAAGILIICLVFLPLLTLEGLEGKLFAPVALTIVFALASSLVLSFTVVPVLAALLLREGGSHDGPWLMRMAARVYTPMLDTALAHPRLFVVGAIGLLGIGLAAWLAIGKIFMPTMDEGDILMQVEKLPAISLAQSVALDLRIERALHAAVPEIRHTIARVGSDELGLDPMSLNDTDMFMQLAPRDSWREPDKAWLTEQIRTVMAGFPGVNFGFTQPIEMRVAEMLTGSRGDLVVKVFGTELAMLAEITRRIENVLTGLPGAEDVFRVTTDGVEYLNTRIDARRAGRFGLDIETIQEELRAQVEGRQAGVIIEGARRVPIVIRAAADLRSDPTRFARGSVVSRTGQSVPLSEVAAFERVEGPVKVSRENASRYAVVQANVSGRDLVGFVDDARAAVAAAVPLPPGYRLEWGGQFENQQRAAARLALVVPVALVLIFIVLFSTFGSLRQAVLVLANIPFALVGGIVALWASGEYMSVPASVGFIALLGIAVLNGLVLVACFNQLLAAGQELATAVREGALRRLRPVLMTAAITAFGLVPMLFASGPGSEIQRPLAIVVIGGLATSTLLTLLLLPVLFRRFGISRGPKHVQSGITPLDAGLSADDRG
ncbi:MAG: CusA/CzcA family heavy metal efflux RND transporter [Gammaproteobacteria bacterium]